MGTGEISFTCQIGSCNLYFHRFLPRRKVTYLQSFFSNLMVDNPAISDANLVVMINIHSVIRNSVTKSPLHARQRKNVFTRLISLTGFFTARLQQKCKCFVFVAASWWRSGFDNIQMTNSQRVLWPWQTRQLIKSKSSTCNRDVKKSQKKNDL